MAWAAATPIVEVSTTCCHAPSGSAGDLPRHPLGHGAVGQAQDDDVGAAGQLGQVLGEHRPGRVPLRPGDVVADDVVAGADEIRRQDAAHVAEADEADGRHAQSVALLFGAHGQHDRRAETPAGAPQ